MVILEGIGSGFGMTMVLLTRYVDDWNFDRWTRLLFSLLVCGDIGLELSPHLLLTIHCILLGWLQSAVFTAKFIMDSWILSPHSRSQSKFMSIR